VDAIRNCGDQRLQKGRRGSHVSTLDQLHEGKLRGAVDSHKEIKLALGGAHLGKIAVEVAESNVSFPMPCFSAWASLLRAFSPSILAICCFAVRRLNLLISTLKVQGKDLSENRSQALGLSLSKSECGI